MFVDCSPPGPPAPLGGGRVMWNKEEKLILEEVGGYLERCYLNVHLCFSWPKSILVSAKLNYFSLSQIWFACNNNFQAISLSLCQCISFHILLSPLLQPRGESEQASGGVFDCWPKLTHHRGSKLRIDTNEKKEDNIWKIFILQWWFRLYLQRYELKISIYFHWHQ